MADKKFGWCFIGSGSITSRVLNDFDKTDGAYLLSVYSRTYDNAKRLAQAYGAQAFESAEEAMAAPGVRGVYIATPHPMHKRYALMALERGLPVLCEKPLAMNYQDAEEMIKCARKNGVYFMEGMWMRFNPALGKALEWIGNGGIGRIRSLTASFSSRCAFDESSRLFNASLGGGSLLDVGIYALAFAHIVMGAPPVRASAVADYAPTGVDSQCAMTFQYDGGAIARLFCGISVCEPQDAYIYGEKGYIKLKKFWAPSAAQIVRGNTETYDAGFAGEGFQFEFDAAMADIGAGRIENALMPHKLSLEIMKTADDCLREIARVN